MTTKPLDVDAMLRQVDRTSPGAPRPRIDREALHRLVPSVEADPAMIAATAKLDQARRDATTAEKTLAAAKSKAAKASGLLSRAIAAGQDLAALRVVRAEGREDHDEHEIMAEAVKVARQRILCAEEGWETAALEAADRVALELRRGWWEPLRAELGRAQHRLTLLTELDRAMTAAMNGAARPRPLMATVTRPTVEYRRKDGKSLSRVAPTAAEEVEPVSKQTLERMPRAEAVARVAAGEVSWAEPWRGELAIGGDHVTA